MDRDLVEGNALGFGLTEKNLQKWQEVTSWSIDLEIEVRGGWKCGMEIEIIRGGTSRLIYMR